MATNVTVRLPWHMNGWNGTVCKDPKGNTYCSGKFSYPGDAIATSKNEAYEIECAGKHCGQIDTPPPCALSCNAFGSEAIRCRHAPPTWFNGAKVFSFDTARFLKRPKECFSSVKSIA